MRDWFWIVLIILVLILFVPTCSVAVNAGAQAAPETSERLSPGWNLITVEGETASQYATKYPCISVIWHYVKPFDLWVAFFPGEDAQVSTDYWMDYNFAYWVYCT